MKKGMNRIIWEMVKGNGKIKKKVKEKYEQIFIRKNLEWKYCWNAIKKKKCNEDWIDEMIRKNELINKIK